MRNLLLRKALGLMIAPWMLAACESSSQLTSPPGEQGWVRARVSGAVETTFEGTGYFSTDPDYRLGLPAKFQFGSDGRGNFEGASIWGVWFDGAIPPPGEYRLVRYSESRPRGFSLTYGRTAEGRNEGFLVTEGVIEITQSSADRVEGRFQGEAVQYCSYPTVGTDENSWCFDEPNEPIPAWVPRIQLTGSFSFVPSDPFAVTPD